MRTIEHWIAGKPTTGISDRTAPVYNPATGAQQADVLLEVPRQQREPGQAGGGPRPRGALCARGSVHLIEAAS